MSTQAGSARLAIPAAKRLSIAVIGPDDFLRGSLLDTLHHSHPAEVHDFPSYPPKLQDVHNLLDQHHDVVMIELDSDPKYAQEVMRAVCADGHSTVMVYSRMAETEIPDPDLLLRCMRAGAREFFSPPFAVPELHRALERAASRQPESQEPQKKRARLLVFCGAKGGAGVTNIACTFAIALRRLSAQKTLFIDMDLPLGDAALNLGIRPRYSTIDALQNYTRIDSSFLAKLVVRHDSGLAVLPAPGRFPFHLAPHEAYDKLFQVARENFDHVVVDAGSKFDLANGCAEYREASILYLVTQSGIPELRNANRLIAQYQSLDGPKLEVVLNRYESKASGITAEQVRRALTCPVSWKIPNDYKAVRTMQDTAAAVATDSSISRQIEAMVRAACGMAPAPAAKKAFSFRRWFAPAKGADKSSSGPLQLGLIEEAPDPGALTNTLLLCPAPAQSGEGPCQTVVDTRRESPWNC